MECNNPSVIVESRAPFQNWLVLLYYHSFSQANFPQYFVTRSHLKKKKTIAGSPQPINHFSWLEKKNSVTESTVETSPTSVLLKVSRFWEKEVLLKFVLEKLI